MSAILNPICRGLVGYISYMAACSSSQVYSEYLLYEPILRIATSKNYSVNCEFPVEGSKNGRGDKRRIDFDLMGSNGERIGIEVKWVKKATINLDNDIAKLVGYEKQKDATGYIVLFGQTDDLKGVKIDIDKQYRQIAKGKMVIWDAGKTSYAAQWFRYKNKNSMHG